MIPSDSIAIDGDTAGWLVSDTQVALMSGWSEALDRPCDTCGGSGMDDDVIDCAHCSGTGGHSFDIDYEDRRSLPGKALATTISRERTLSVHVVDVLPIAAVDHWIEGESCVDTLGNLWFPCWTREDEPAHYLAGHALIPSAAKPGDWIVQLAIHERNQ